MDLRNVVGRKLSQAQIETLSRSAVDDDGLVSMRYTNSRTIEILSEYGLIEKRLEFDIETESRALGKCVDRAKNVLLEQDDWKEAWHLLNEAFEHSKKLKRTAWFITDAGRDFLKIAGISRNEDKRPLINHRAW